MKKSFYFYLGILLTFQVGQAMNPNDDKNDPDNNSSALSIPVKNNSFFINSKQLLDTFKLKLARWELKKDPDAFKKACMQNDIEKINLLIAAGAPLENRFSESILHEMMSWPEIYSFKGHCIEDKSARLIPFFIQKGISVNHRNYNNLTPLHEGARAIFLGRNTLEFGRNALEKIRILLEHQAFVNQTDGTGRAPLHFASANHSIHSLRCIKLLIDYGSSINSSDIHGCTPLHHATANSRNDAERVAILIENGAEINALNCEGETPLYTGVRNDCCKKAIKLLIKKGASVNVKNRKGRTPLHETAQSIFGRNRLTELLLNYGATVDAAADDDGNTPLHIGVSVHGIGRNLYPLLIRGASIYLKNNKGETPLHCKVAKKVNHSYLTFYCHDTESKFYDKPVGAVIESIDGNKCATHKVLSIETDIFGNMCYHIETTTTFKYPLATLECLLSACFFSPSWQSFEIPEVVKQKNLNKLETLRKLATIAIIKHWNVYRNLPEIEKYFDFLQRFLIDVEGCYEFIAELPFKIQQYVLQHSTIEDFSSRLLQAHCERHLRALKFLLTIKDSFGITAQGRLLEKYTDAEKLVNQIFLANSFDDLDERFQDLIANNLKVHLGII